MTGSNSSAFGMAHRRLAFCAAAPCHPYQTAPVTDPIDIEQSLLLGSPDPRIATQLLQFGRVCPLSSSCAVRALNSTSPQSVPRNKPHLPHGLDITRAGDSQPWVCQI